MKYTLRLTSLDENNKIYFDTIEADTLIEIAARFPLMIAMLTRRESDEEMEVLKMKFVDDDIPF